MLLKYLQMDGATNKEYASTSDKTIDTILILFLIT